MMIQRVRVLKKVQQINLAGRGLGPFEADSEADVWSWEAKVLEKQGLIERKKIAPADVRGMIVAEERNSRLEKLPDGFYFSIRQEISTLRTAGEGEKADELKSQVLTLFEIRLSKLLILSLSPDDSGDIPAEEKFLVNRLAAVLDSWTLALGEFLEAEEGR